MILFAMHLYNLPTIRRSPDRKVPSGAPGEPMRGGGGGDQMSPQDQSRSRRAVKNSQPSFYCSFPTLQRGKECSTIKGLQAKLTITAVSMATDT